MIALAQRTVDVFPINTSAFAFQAGWFEHYSPKLIYPAYMLMVLLLVISVGIMVLRRFEGAELEKKLWNIPIIVTVVAFWPFLVLGLKDLVDMFNTFLVREVFQIPWVGFGFPEMGSVRSFMGWSAEAVARLLPNLAYWVVYAFYLIFFFFFAALGPFVLAKGILFDEVDAFLEIVKEMTGLLLWQTTLVILVAFIMPEIVSGRPLPPNPQANFYFLSLVLGIMIFFVPSITRKFGNHLGSSFLPPGTTWIGTMLGISALGRMTTKSLYGLGLTSSQARMYWPSWSQRVITAEMHNNEHRYNEDLERRNRFFKQEIWLSKQMEKLVETDPVQTQPKGYTLYGDLTPSLLESHQGALARPQPMLPGEPAPLPHTRRSSVLGTGARYLKPYRQDPYVDPLLENSRLAKNEIHSQGDGKGQDSGGKDRPQ